MSERGGLLAPEPERITGTVTDPDDQEYQWQSMKDGKEWMVENLNYDIPGHHSSWYGQDPGIGEEYGRLYDWEAAKAACADLGDGWRLPTANDWYSLVDAHGGWVKKWDWNSFSFDIYSSSGYTALIKGGSSGFSALLGGSVDFSGINFNGLGVIRQYWSASDEGDEYLEIIYNFSGYFKNIRSYYYSKEELNSCRCVRRGGTEG